MSAERVLENPLQTPPELREYRATIDNIGAALMYLPAERFRCTQKVGQLKTRLGLLPSGPAHEAQQVKRLQVLAEKFGLDPEFAKKFLRFIVDEVIHYHAAWRDPDPVSPGS